MAKVYATAKGAAMKTNNWVEGQEISCGDHLALVFIERGIATAEKQEAEAKADASETGKSKTGKSKK